MALIVTNTGTDALRWVEWGQEGALTYNAATSLLIDSDSLVTSGFAGTGSTRTGAYDPGAAGNSVITCSLSGDATAVCGTGVQSHVGVFRVRARVWTATSTVRLRLAWRVAGGSYSTNLWTAPVVLSRFASADLGTITVPRVLLGTQAWDGRIEAYTTDGSAASVDVDLVALMPATDGYGKVRATLSNVTGVGVASDSFTGTTVGGSLNGRTAPTGGTWATSGDATDFTFNDLHSDEQVLRTVASSTNGRLALLGSSLTDCETEALVQQNGMRTGMSLGIVARATDISNCLRFVIADGTPRQLRLEQIVAGVVTVLETNTTYVAATSVVHKLRMVVYASGRIVCSAAADEATSAPPIFGALQPIFDTVAAVAAPGGALASGKSGLFDRNPDASGSTREWDAFAARIPAPEPVVAYPSRTLKVRSDDAIRDDSTGTYTARPPSYRGSRFTVPVGTGRVAVFAHTQDLEVSAWEPAVASFSAQVGWTMRGLAVPR
jgi:hypothetical protein